MNRGAALLLLLLGVPAARGEVREPRATPAPSSIFQAPLDFEENLGQADPAVGFLARARGCLALFTSREAMFVCGGGPDPVRMGFPGARPGRFEAEGRRPGLTHHLPRVAGARRFGRILRRDLWPGVDLRWDGGPGRRLEYSFVLAPGADPRRISLSFEGGTARMDGPGNLLVATPGGVLRHGRPRAFQGEVEVPAAFFPRPDGTVGFHLGPFDPALPLVVDPQVVFTSNYGGSDADEAWAVGSDPAGNLYFAGWALSPNLPVTSGVLQGTFQGNYDAFVLKRSPRGASLVYATYLGGEGADLAYALAVDDLGGAVVAGGSSSGDFPSTPGSFQPVRGTGAETGFVARLTPSGAALSWSTFLGGSVHEAVRGIRLGPAGDAYLVGTTASPDFPVPGGAQPSLSGSSDAFVAKLAAGGGSLAWGTYLGGVLLEEGRALGLGADGTVFVAGMTESIDFPDVNALKTTLTGSRDAFAASIAPDGGTVNWATFLGGDGLEEGWGLTVDATGAPWVVGYTTSAGNFPLVSAVDAVYGGQFEAFATKFAADGSAILVSTYLGGSGSDKAEAACSDGNGVVYVVGRTASGDFPVKDAVDKDFGGGDYDAFITALAPGGTALLWSTYRGAGGSDFAMAAAVDRYNSVVVAGRIDGNAGDGFTTAIIAVPLPPSSLTAKLTGNARVLLTWPDQGIDEDGYIVQRREGEGPWADIKFLAKNTLQFTDNTLAYATTYSWRVVAYNNYGSSAPSPEATATTLPDPVAPPAAPANLQVTSFDTRRVSLAWTDNSADEDSFILERFEPGIGFFVHATLDRNVKSYSDATVFPLRTYRYRVHGVNARGHGLSSPEVSVTLDASFGMTIESGRRKTKADPKKDSLVIEGRVVHEADTRWSSFDPRPRTFEVRLGADPFALVSLPENYAGWKAKKGTWVLKYPYSARGKLTIVVDPEARTFKLTLSKADLHDAPAGPEEVRLLFGDDGATFDIPWEPGRKAGDYRLP